MSDLQAIEPVWRDSKFCPHSDRNVCRFCDFDRYYARTYESCPWREVDA